MTDVIERYLPPGLRLGKHVDGLVDAYQIRGVRTYAGVLAGEGTKLRLLLTEDVRVADLLAART